jgi:hypothetical protein
MRQPLLGVLVGGFLVIATAAISGFAEPVTGGPRDRSSPRPHRPLMTHVTATEGQPQVVTVIDAERRVMAVYHVDRATGEIALKSVRNMTWDLEMLEFNTGEPLPQEIRDMRRGLQP